MVVPYQKFYTSYLVRTGPVARIPRSHRGGRGSVPRCGDLFFRKVQKKNNLLNLLIIIIIKFLILLKYNI